MQNREHPVSVELQTIGKMLAGMNFGSLTIIIQDGKIIQIDKIEKYRLKN